MSKTLRKNKSSIKNKSSRKNNKSKKNFKRNGKARNFKINKMRGGERVMDEINEKINAKNTRLLLYGGLNEEELNILSTALQTNRTLEPPIKFVEADDLIKNPQNPKFETFTTLQTFFAGLYIKNSNIQDDILGGILAPGLKQMTNLRSLIIDNNKIGAVGAQALAEGLIVNTTLKLLDISNNNIGDEGAIALAKALENKEEFTTLTITNNNIGVEGGKALANALRGKNKFQDLDITNNNIGNEGVKALTEVLDETGIQYLRLARNNINSEGEGTNPIGDALPSLEFIRVLDISFNNIPVGNGVLKYIKVLRYNQNFTDLYINDTKMNNIGAKSIAYVLKKNNCSLQTIKINNNEIGDEGAIALAEALKINDTLKYLYINNNKIGDAGAKAFATVLGKNGGNTRLEGLYINGNPINNIGNKYLSNAINSRAHTSNEIYILFGSVGPVATNISNLARL